jgi:predicted nucleic acid-binding protein
MPGDDRPVVVNATPIIALSLLGRLDLLRSLYPIVVIPEAVRAEILAGGRRRIGTDSLLAASWLRTVPLQDQRRADLLEIDLDRGEAEVLALALELDAKLVILDERLARRHAQRLGLGVTGSVGVLLRGKETGQIDAIAPLLAQLQKEGIRLGSELVEKALSLASESPMDR